MHSPLANMAVMIGVVGLFALVLALAWAALLTKHYGARRPCDAQDLRYAGREGRES